MGLKTVVRKISRGMLYLWQLPQNLIGLFLTLLYPAQIKHKVNGNVVYINNRFSGGISLGRYVILSRDIKINIQHELGHCKQSQWLGPLYLFVIGLPSLLHAAFHNCDNYYHFYTEKWADKIAGIDRKK